MKEVTVTKVGVGSFGKLLGFANAIVSLAIGIIGAIVSTVTVVTSNDFNVAETILATLGIVAGYIIFLPLLAFAFGWLYGAVVALVWNVLLGASNGLDLEIVDKKK